MLQAADILLYRADLVPVGEDQVQHLELSREIARRWNARFGEGYFPEPQAKLTPSRRIMGLDGNAKMSKSMGNTVGLLEAPEAIWEKLRPAVTDPARVRKTDPGTPEVCNIYHLHRAFSPPDVVAHVETQCRTAGWGCIECKKVLFENINTELAPIRARAAEIRARPELVDQVIGDGAADGAARRGRDHARGEGAHGARVKWASPSVRPHASCTNRAPSSPRARDGKQKGRATSPRWSA